jgi:hypothetical protein
MVMAAAAVITVDRRVIVVALVLMAALAHQRHVSTTNSCTLLAVFHVHSCVLLSALVIGSSNQQTAEC